MYEKIAVGRCISKLSNQIRRRLDSFSAKSGVSGSQGRVLHFVLAQPEDVFQRDIEQEFNMRPPSATELLKVMERNGLIRRESIAQDARLKKIIVTEKAAGLVGQVFPDLEELERDLTKGISPEQLEVFYQVIGQMSENLKD